MLERSLSIYRRAKLSNLCSDIVERKYVFRRRRLEKLRSTEAVDVPSVSAIRRELYSIGKAPFTGLMDSRRPLEPLSVLSGMGVLVK